MNNSASGNTARQLEFPFFEKPDNLTGMFVSGFRHVALCLSGQIRSFDQTKDSLLENVIKPNNCDVFCHFWHKHDGSMYKNFWNEDGIAYGSFGRYPISDVVNHIEPKSFLIEEPYYEDSTRSMLCSIMKANQLKTEYENLKSFKYNVVIRARLDLFYNKKLCLNKILSIDKKTIYVRNRRIGHPDIDFSDWFAYGDSNTMDIYSNAFNAFKDTERIKQPRPEEIFLEHFENNDISVKGAPIGDRQGLGMILLREDGAQCR